jgi:hypothetical protein
MGCVDNPRDCHMLNFTRPYIQYKCESILKPSKNDYGKDKILLK